MTSHIHISPGLGHFPVGFIHECPCGARFERVDTEMHDNVYGGTDYVQWRQIAPQSKAEPNWWRCICGEWHDGEERRAGGLTGGGLVMHAPVTPRQPERGDSE